jgi:hypothetical protein
VDVMVDPNPSLRATGTRERAPDDRLREAIRGQGTTAYVAQDYFVALLLAMTMLRRCLWPIAPSLIRNVTRCVTARRANHLVSAKTCPAPRAKINRFAMTPNQIYNYRRPVPT